MRNKDNDFSLFLLRTNDNSDGKSEKPQMAGRAERIPRPQAVVHRAPRNDLAARRAHDPRLLRVRIPRLGQCHGHRPRGTLRDDRPVPSRAGRDLLRNPGRRGGTLGRNDARRGAARTARRDRLRRRPVAAADDPLRQSRHAEQPDALLPRHGRRTARRAAARPDGGYPRAPLLPRRGAGAAPHRPHPAGVDGRTALALVRRRGHRRKTAP